ncbi:MAG: hypothetical protein KDD82_00995 [Planctomycetes bacterium]|nr:hypothetical protein [Planctomycetota bacterium]
MSDDRLLASKRAWERSKSPADEAAYLRERVRAGELDPARLELAAYCGHDAARLAHGGDAGANTDLRFTITWLKRLLGAAPPIATRAAVIYAQQAHLAALEGFGQGLVDALLDWTAAPTPEAVARIHRETEAVLEAAEARDLPAAREAAQVLIQAALVAEGLPWSLVDEVPPPKALRAVRDAIKAELAPWLLGS